MVTRKSLAVSRECRICGRLYPLQSKRTHCSCGGYIYTISQIYQPKVNHAIKK